jgi:hypothetical protein
METLSSDFVNSWIKMGIEYVTDKLEGVPPGASNIMHVTARAMEIVETMPCTGDLKADFAVAIVDALVWRLPESDDKAYLANMSASGGLRNAIDIIVKATKGELDVNKVVQAVKEGRMRACCRWLTAKCAPKPR